MSGVVQVYDGREEIVLSNLDIQEETLVHQTVDISGVMITEPRSVPFVLSFSNLTYCVKVFPKISISNLCGASRKQTIFKSESMLSRTKTVLDNVSGEAREGEILAILGASGCGKSTLMDALANRIAKGSLKGTVTLNNEQLESRLLKVISAYVMQDDLLFPMLTVEETLMFAAEFRLPRTLTKSKKRLRVQTLIDQLGLRNAANTVIGDEGHRGVSGGERRRVSIGIDIIHDPILLFLDEPTSGLDSTSAYMVVKVLQRIAKSGSIVIMSVHQPSYRILGLLDQLLFLSRGQTVYSSSPQNLPRFFTDFGLPMPQNEDIIEFALDRIRELEATPGGIRSLVEFNRAWQGMKISRRKTNIYVNSPSPLHELSLKEAISASILRGKLVSGATSNDISRASVLVPKFANPIWKEIAVLAKRSVTNSRRMPKLFGVRVGALMTTAFIFASVFWNLDNTPKSIQERLGFFAFAMYITFNSCVDDLPVFLHERYIFMRETAYNAYRRSSYVVAHAIVVLPTLVLLAALFASLTFWGVGLDGGLSGFLYYFLMMLASFWAGSSFVTLVSGVVPNVILGYTVMVAILAYFTLFSGFYMTRERIPEYWIWLHYISLIKFSFEAVLQNEFENGNKCFVRGVEIFDNSPLVGLPNAIKMSLLENMSNTLGMPINGSTCFTTGPDILKQRGVTELSKWNCLFVMVAWGFLFRILFYFTLLLGSKNKRS
ncbi:ABC transporter domain-containing protein [Heracleum sosnowskyi]|uniref:ABC transporter domain-containing protein n=1 Tax=Heracleum sosnowskyi TaxID=360622 RepID=A0AAD8I9M4_9APIA|nr:ABC transporter domain-containing protein [Heracleum sosnowskyi]